MVDQSLNNPELFLHKRPYCDKLLHGSAGDCTEAPGCIDHDGKRTSSSIRKTRPRLYDLGKEIIRNEV